jgi:hypothetical protein
VRGRRQRHRRGDRLTATARPTWYRRRHGCTITPPAVAAFARGCAEQAQRRPDVRLAALAQRATVSAGEGAGSWSSSRPTVRPRVGAGDGEVAGYGTNSGPHITAFGGGGRRSMHTARADDAASVLPTSSTSTPADVHRAEHAAEAAALAQGVRDTTPPVTSTKGVTATSCAAGAFEAIISPEREGWARPPTDTKHTADDVIPLMSCTANPARGAAGAVELVRVRPSPSRARSRRLTAGRRRDPRRRPMLLDGKRAS